MTHNANIQSQNFGYISIFMLIYTFLETTKKPSNLVLVEFYYTFFPMSTIFHYNFPITTLLLKHF